MKHVDLSNYTRIWNAIRGIEDPSSIFFTVSLSGDGDQAVGFKTEAEALTEAKKLRSKGRLIFIVPMRQEFTLQDATDTLVPFYRSLAFLYKPVAAERIPLLELLCKSSFVRTDDLWGAPDSELPKLLHAAQDRLFQMLHPGLRQHVAAHGQPDKKTSDWTVIIGVLAAEMKKKGLEVPIPWSSFLHRMERFASRAAKTTAIESVDSVDEGGEEYVCPDASAPCDFDDLPFDARFTVIDTKIVNLGLNKRQLKTNIEMLEALLEQSPSATHISLSIADGTGRIPIDGESANDMIQSLRYQAAAHGHRFLVYRLGLEGWVLDMSIEGVAKGGTNP